jgi:hypothetical protein
MAWSGIPRSEVRIIRVNVSPARSRAATPLLAPAQWNQRVLPR